MRSLLIKKGCSSDSVEYVPNWADLNEISYEKKSSNEIIRELGWEEKVVFTFFGNIGRLQGVKNLIDAISLVRNDDCRFLFIGDGAESEMVSMAASKDQRIHFYGELSHKYKNLGLTSCDVSIVSLQSGMYGLGVPSKAYFSLASNRPLLIVADQGSELDLLCGEYDIGWSCESGSPEILSKFIDTITNEIKEEKTSFNTRMIVSENFSELGSLKKILKTLEMM